MLHDLPKPLLDREVHDGQSLSRHCTIRPLGVMLIGWRTPCALIG